MECRALMKDPKYQKLYTQSYTQELGWLVQGLCGKVARTNTIFFIVKDDVPQERWHDVVYSQVVVNYWPEKSNSYQTRLTVGGNRVNFPKDCNTPTVDLLTVKLLINSVVPTPGVKFMTIIIKDFYLNTLMLQYKYIFVKISNLPKDVIVEYGLAAKATTDRYVYVEIRHWMYGFPQAGLLAQ